MGCWGQVAQTVATLVTSPTQGGRKHHRNTACNSASSLDARTHARARSAALLLFEHPHLPRVFRTEVAEGAEGALTREGRIYVDPKGKVIRVLGKVVGEGFETTLDDVSHERMTKLCPTNG